jgi:hypothetical protein
MCRHGEHLGNKYILVSSSFYPHFVSREYHVYAIEACVCVCVRAYKIIDEVLKYIKSYLILVKFVMDYQRKEPI